MQVLDFQADNFEGQNLKRPGTYAVMFTAQWCGFCRAFMPTFTSVFANQGLQPALVDLSDWENPLWEIFDVQVIPTVVIFKDGKPVARKNAKLGVGLNDVEVNSLIQEFKKRTPSQP